MIHNYTSYTTDGGAGNLDWQYLVDLFYSENTVARDILVTHSKAVAGLALRINADKQLGLDPRQIEYAAMLHDIGIIKTNAPGIGCFGTESYIRHGVLGADMLREVSAPEWAARVAERHTGSGLTRDEITARNLPLPSDRILMPGTLLERLICYADKFFSKNPERLSEQKSLETVRSELARHGAESLSRYNDLYKEFGT